MKLSICQELTCNFLEAGIEMNLKEIIARLNLEVADNSIPLDKEIKHAYCSDMLSEVVCNAKGECIWITSQIHHNTVGVAVMKEIAALLITNNRKPEIETLKKAKYQHVPILLTGSSSFEICASLHELGIRG